MFPPLLYTKDWTQDEHRESKEIRKKVPTLSGRRKLFVLTAIIVTKLGDRYRDVVGSGI